MTALLEIIDSILAGKLKLLWFKITNVNNYIVTFVCDIIIK